MRIVIGISLDIVPDVNATMSRGVPNQMIMATTKPTIDAFREAGAIVFGLPEVLNLEMAIEACKSIDSLVIPGGPDIYPGSFGKPVSRFNGTMCPEKDKSDIYYLEAMFSLGKPILGICRGMQLMNILKGGTLIEDISRFTDSLLLHSSPHQMAWLKVHDVVFEEGSIISNMFGVTRMSVNSFHHQSIENIGKGFYCSGKSEDGIVESIEDKSGKWIGVQWHPEYMYEKYPENKSFFKKYVEYLNKFIAEQN